MPIPYVHSDTTYNVMLDARGLNTNSPYVRIVTRYNASNLTGYVTVLYTKNS